MKVIERKDDWEEFLSQDAAEKSCDKRLDGHSWTKKGLGVNFSSESRED